ncbi:MAG: hypothetical protein ACYTG2_00265 [Planctomycetota bacterium]|jgi:hypothetical protein
MRRAPLPLPLALCFSVLLLCGGCGSSNPSEEADAAQAALSQGDFATARAKAKSALAAEGVADDKALTWKLERIGLEAAAGEGKGAEVLSAVDRLSGSFAAQVNAELYAKLGNRLADGGDPAGALDVADAGKQRFPEQAAAFDALIESLKTKASSNSELADKLKSMGYL